MTDEQQEQWNALLGMTSLLSDAGVKGGIFVHGSSITVETERGEQTFWANTSANRAHLVAMHLDWLDHSLIKPRGGLANGSTTDAQALDVTNQEEDLSHERQD